MGLTALPPCKYDEIQEEEKIELPSRQRGKKITESGKQIAAHL